MVKSKMFAGLAVVLLATPKLYADAATDERIAELERKVDILTRQAEKREMGEAFVPIGESWSGMGPAASKVYQKADGVSIGGYGEALYQNREAATDSFDFLRAVLYVGYKFNPQWVFNSEIEFEHATTDKEGEVSAEFAYLDYLYHEHLNFRAGLVLVPMGLVNELHEPTTFLGAQRPEVERRIIPTTWRENGVGLYGDVGSFSYKTYLITGFKGEDFSASGLRGGRQKGSKAAAEDLAWVGRLDWKPTPGFVAGGSAYYGRAGQDLDLSLTTTLLEGHLDWQWKGLQFRALGVLASVDDVAALNALRAAEDGVDVSEVDSVGEEQWGWYVELGYDVLNRFDTGSQRLVPFLRYEQLDTQAEVPADATASGANRNNILALGLDYKPFEQVVFKGEWQQREADAGATLNQFNLGMGYVF